MGAVDLKFATEKLTLANKSVIPVSSDLEGIISAVRPQVMVDFSTASATLQAATVAAEHGVHLVIGTTGLSQDDLKKIEKIVTAGKIGAVAASNFAIGAILMMHFARIAAKFMDYAEIVEMHHNLKADAPSGTSLSTARMMAGSRDRPFLHAADYDKNYPSRGQEIEGIPIHSVRLPGLMAHQEVILGGPGQTLTIRHDTINRECYVPGVILAIKEVVNRRGLIQGLDKLMNL